MLTYIDRPCIIHYISIALVEGFSYLISIGLHSILAIFHGKYLKRPFYTYNTVYNVNNYKLYTHNSKSINSLQFQNELNDLRVQANVKICIICLLLRIIHVQYT